MSNDGKSQEVSTALGGKKAMLAVVIEGGLVQGIISNTPELFDNIGITVIDYDIDDPDPGDFCLGATIDMTDGSIDGAYIREENVSLADIDLEAVSGFVKGSIVGANQIRFGVCGENPCEGCRDVCLDGQLCVNEDNCLAWRAYSEEREPLESRGGL